MKQIVTIIFEHSLIHYYRDIGTINFEIKFDIQQFKVKI